MYRRSRHRSRPTLILAGAAVIVLIAAGWYFWPDGTATDAGAASVTDDRPQPSLLTADDVERPASFDPSGEGAARAQGREEQTLPPPERDPSGGRDNQRESSPIEMGAPPEEATGSPDRAESPPVDPAARAEPSEPTPAPISPDRTPGVDSDRPATESARRAFARAQAGLDLLAQNQPVDGRRRLTEALDSGALSETNERMVRDQLTALGDRLVFSPEIVSGDPFALAYLIEPNDALARLPRKLGVHIDWRFIQRINRIERPERIRPGQRIKIITGPFHAVIHKRLFRMDLYLDDGSERAYVRSFPVGLGEYNSTPEGRFRVRSSSKLMNPEWVNPRTGQRFLPDDPTNPIGEHWIGLVGDEPHLEAVRGYGIHGTIEPETIGRQASMGCVRMLPDDVEIIWQVLTEDVSTVEIRP